MKTTGSGPALVMLHGWGANSGVWAGIREQLAENFSLIMIDLPGHGQSGFDATVMRDMRSLAAELAGQVDESATWLGWSLGGMAAMAIARMFPEKVDALVTVASSPRFLQAEDWPYAVDKAVLNEFSTQVQKDPHKALLRFIALQTRGSDTSREDSRVLREAMLGTDMAQGEALASGLNLLERTDLRSMLTGIHCPTLVISGDRDTLHPLQSMQATAGHIANAELKVVSKAGHAPFISHRQEFVETMIDFSRRRKILSSKT